MSEQKAMPFFPLSIDKKDDFPLAKYAIGCYSKMSFTVQLPILKENKTIIELTPHVAVVALSSVEDVSYHKSANELHKTLLFNGMKLFHCLNMDVPQVNLVGKKEDIRHLALYLCYRGDFPSREYAEQIAPIMLESLFETYHKYTNVEVPIRKQIEIKEELVLAFEHVWKEEKLYKVVTRYSDKRFVKNVDFNLKFLSKVIQRHDHQTAGIHFPTFSIAYKFSLTRSHRKNRNYPIRDVNSKDIRLASNGTPIYETKHELSIDTDPHSFVLQVTRQIIYDNLPFHDDQKTMIKQLLKQIKEDPIVLKMCVDANFFDLDKLQLPELPLFVKQLIKDKTTELLQDHLFKLL